MVLPIICFVPGQVIARCMVTFISDLTYCGVVSECALVISAVPLQSLHSSLMCLCDRLTRGLLLKRIHPPPVILGC